MMRPGDASIRTEEAYLICLGRKLLRYFPIQQVEEILEDYQGHFSLGRERGSADRDMMAALGTPEAVTKEILREMPEGWLYLIRHTIRWGLLLILSCCCLYLRRSFYEFWIALGTYTCMLGGSVLLFILLHGRGQAVLEGRFRQSPPRLTAAYLLPLAVVAALEGLAQYFASVGARLPAFLTAGQVGPLFSILFEAVRIIFPLLLIWLLWRSCAVSIRCFPAAVCVLGGIFFTLEMERIMHNMKVDYTPQHLKYMLAGCLLPYFIAVFAAVVFGKYIRRFSSQ